MSPRHAAELRVAVAGSGACDEDHDHYRCALEVGRLVAQAGGTVVCGGLGGVMEAVCRGVHEAGGVSVGLLPGTDPHDANEWVTVPIATGLGEGRNVLIVRNADVVIALGGEYGTLSEMALALRAGVPVVGIDTWDLGRGRGGQDPVHRVDTADEAVALALRLSGR
ncbi:MAG: TIGR00725 family protein [Acidimicrobiales bacterium]